MVPPMATTVSREKTVDGLVFHKLGQNQIRVFKERP